MAEAPSLRALALFYVLMCGCGGRTALTSSGLDGRIETGTDGGSDGGTESASDGGGDVGAEPTSEGGVDGGSDGAPCVIPKLGAACSPGEVACLPTPALQSDCGSACADGLCYYETTWLCERGEWAYGMALRCGMPPVPLPPPAGTNFRCGPSLHTCDRGVEYCTYFPTCIMTADGGNAHDYACNVIPEACAQERDVCACLARINNGTPMGSEGECVVEYTCL